MNVTSLHPKNSTEIAKAIEQVYRKAGFDFEALSPGIVPLYDLISAYSLRVTARPNLSYQSAIKYVSAETGQPIVSSEKADKPISGFLYVCRYHNRLRGWILVEKNEPIVRQRFSAAHELGHYVLHFLPIFDQPNQISPTQSLMLAEKLLPEKELAENSELRVEMSYEVGGESKTYNAPIDLKQMEFEADQFAAELLMPTTACQSLVQQQLRRRSNIQRDALAIRLAPNLLVSKTAMRRRLESLGLPGTFKSDTRQPTGES
jgi:Zn-dependent peptidase ImmA (M78 family)